MRATRMAALLALPLLMTMSAASANKPVRIDYGPLYVSQFFVADCGSFNVLNDYSLQMTGTYFYDRNGQPIRDSVLVRIGGNSTYYNSNNPSIAISGGPGETEFQRTDWVDNTLAVIGSGFRVTLPGQGVIFIDAGRVILDFSSDPPVVTFAAGQTDYFSANSAKLCAALAGP